MTTTTVQVPGREAGAVRPLVRERVAQCRELIDRIERAGGPPAELEPAYVQAVNTVEQAESELATVDSGLGFLPLVPTLLWGLGLMGLAGAAYTLTKVADTVADETRRTIQTTGQTVRVATWGLTAIGLWFLVGIARTRRDR